MQLTDYKPMQERCSNCSYCKAIPYDQIKSARFSENCPSICYNNFNAYSARGRFQLGLALGNGELEYDEKTTEVVHSCLSCGACDVSCKICRYNLEPLEHNIAMKADAVSKGAILMEQKEMLSSLQIERTLIPDMRRADRNKWNDALGLPSAFDTQFDALFFPGCKYAYDESLQGTLTNTVKLLRAADVKLAVLGQADMCCAGRAWQMGFVSEFKQQASQNIELIKKTGAKLVVTPCSDCYHALKRLYPELGLDIEVLHVIEYIDRLITEGRLRFTTPINAVVTYHDPCHLGRQGEPYVEWHGEEKKILNQIHTWNPARPRYNGAHGIYDAPRRVLEAVPGVELCEMERIREYSWCCGSGGGCSQTMPELANYTATERVIEAKSTGAKYLVTACPWCQSILTLASNEIADAPVPVDIVELACRAL